MKTSIAAPPRPLNTKGASRRVGVEMEFAGLRVADAADLVHHHFGGDCEQRDPHRFVISGTAFGDFEVELDSRHVHPNEQDENTSATSGQPDDWIENGRRVGRQVDAQARAILGDTVAGLVPCEIVSPPIPWDKLDALDPLLNALRALGAEGTDAHPLYGFGLHLNPEVAEDSVGYVLAHLRAYLVLADQLRADIGVDMTRRLLPHADPFPVRYGRRILDERYAPDMTRLIRDYAKDNPSRNRELDMYPLFASLDEETVARVNPDPRIKPRPTFHYRLPDMRLSDPNWGVVDEWNRWVAVEALAADTRRLSEAGAKWCGDHAVDLDLPWWGKLKMLFK